MPTSGISDLEAVAGAGGFKFENKDTVYLRFNGDEIDVKYSYHDDWDNEVLEDFIDGGNNGVIFAKNSEQILIPQICLELFHRKMFG
jgi:hypothetical protein